MNSIHPQFSGAAHEPTFGIQLCTPRKPRWQVLPSKEAGASEISAESRLSMALTLTTAKVLPSVTDRHNRATDDRHIGASGKGL